jgi:hypothetical protein
MAESKKDLVKTVSEPEKELRLEEVVKALRAKVDFMFREVTKMHHALDVIGRVTTNENGIPLERVLNIAEQENVDVDNIEDVVDAVNFEAQQQFDAEQLVAQQNEVQPPN